MKILIVVFTIALVGCGKGGTQTASSLHQTIPQADPASPADPAILKDIYSSWSDIDANRNIDSIQLFQSGSVSFTVSNNTCTCTGTIDANNGVVNAVNCPVSNQGSDCSIYIGQYTYTIDSTSTLKFCPSVGSCAKFQ